MNNTYEVLTFIKPSADYHIPYRKLKDEYGVVAELINGSPMYINYSSNNHLINPIKIRSSTMAMLPFFEEVEDSAFNEDGIFNKQNITCAFVLARIEDTCFIIINYNEAKHPAIKLLVNSQTARAILDHHTENDGYINKDFVNLDTCKEIKVYITNNSSIPYEVMANIFNKTSSSITIEELKKIPQDVELTEQDLIQYKIQPFSIIVNESAVDVIEKLGDVYVLYSWVLKNFADEIETHLTSRDI